MSVVVHLSKHVNTDVLGLLIYCLVRKLLLKIINVEQQ